MSKSTYLAYANASPIDDKDSLRLVEAPIEAFPAHALVSDVFHITMREDDAASVFMIGRANRKHTIGYLNIPVGRNLRERLERQIVGSLAMGVSGLLEWALAEIERKQVSLEIQARP